MAYFDNNDNVQQYLAACEPEGARTLIEQLQRHLKAGASILELGMGPGFDLDMLNEHYQAVGSDFSEHFLNAYRKRKQQATQTGAEVLQLDASKPQANKCFDGVYSNKVLHQFAPEVLGQSFDYQAALLNHGGIVFHSFWYGTGHDVFAGDAHYYYRPEDIQMLLREHFKVLEHDRYEEFEPGDSFWLIAQKQA